MYISGFYLINGISMFFSSFQNKIGLKKNSDFPEYINCILEHRLINFFDYCLSSVQFGICICIFFNL